MLRRFVCFTAIVFCLTASLYSRQASAKEITPDKIYFNGKIVTVDANFTIAQAVAIKDKKFLTIGTDEQILKTAGANTEKVDLRSKTVIPGLIDAHGHPDMAALSEISEEIPVVRTIQEILDSIAEKTKSKAPGEWIIYPKLFSTRVREMRWPTKQQLDLVAPNNPVLLDGTYGGMVNSYALKISNITEDTRHKGVLKDKNTGQPTGLLRSSAFDFLKGKPKNEVTYQQKSDAIIKMFKAYNSVGITGANIGMAGPEEVKLFQELRDQRRLTARILLNIHLAKLGIKAGDQPEKIRKKLKDLGYSTGSGDKWVRIGPLKWHMDGGILTGTAYLRQPWAATYPDRVKEVYGITDPAYRGVLLVTKEQLVPVVAIANELGWKFTAHCTGGGGVDVMLDAFEQVNKTSPITEKRFSIIHGNFFTQEAIERMRKLGVYADLQPAWFYKDADAMKHVLGEERVKDFLPLKSLFDAGIVINAGSDHMIKFDSYTSTNPYNPFLAMWSMITRKTERRTIINKNQAITRAQALKMYTINNARACFEEDIKGSIDPGKLADMVILSDDILTCPVDNIKDIKAELTMLGGKVVYQR